MVSVSYTVSQLYDLLLELMRLHRDGDPYPSARSLFLWGPTGIGKTYITRETAVLNGLKVFELHLGSKKPSDFTIAVPIKKDDGSYYADFIPVMGFLSDIKEDEPYVLFLDEINLAHPTIQSIAYKIVHERQIGEYPLPGKPLVIAAGNRIEDSPNVYKIPPPLGNRFTHIIVEPDVEGWLEWASSHNIHPTVISYINSTKELHNPKDDLNYQYGFPTPRAWERVSQTEYLFEERRISSNTRSILIEGDIGTDAANRYFKFRDKLMALPSIDELMECKEMVDMSNLDADILYYYATSYLSKFYDLLLNDLNYLIRTESWFNLLLSFPEEYQVMIFKLLLSSRKYRREFDEITDKLIDLSDAKPAFKEHFEGYYNE